MTTFDDKPLAVQFPELNSWQISKLREMLKAEYERGQIEGAEDYVKYGYGERCKVKDFVDFPELKQTDIQGRCPSCVQYEFLDEYLNQLKKGTK